MSIRVTELDDHAAGLWETYVAGHPEGTLFHTLLWRDAVAEAFGHRSRYLAAWRDGRIVGVFPLTRVDSRLAGTLLVSVPYAVYGGTLADDEEVHEILLRAAMATASEMNAQWLDIRSIRARWPRLPVLDRYVAFRRPLPQDPRRVLAETPRKARADARQARERFGLVCRFDDARLDDVWRLYSRSMRRLASPNYPIRFFRSLMSRTRAGWLAGRRVGHVVQVVEHGGRAIAGLVSFIDRDTLMPYFAGCDERFEKYHPNHFLYLSAMERGVELGCREFDLGRSRVENRGACDFKRFLGARPIRLEYQYVTPPGGRAPDLTPENPRLAWARRVWTRLPLAVTRPLGARLAREVTG